MKKIIDLIAESSSHKDEKLLDYIRKKYLIKNYITNLCFITGQGEDYEHHTQPSADELRTLMLETNDNNTLYFLRSFFFDKDRDNYLKLMEDVCNANIQVFKTDQIEEHVTSNKNWTNKYCQFITLDDLEND